MVGSIFITKSSANVHKKRKKKEKNWQHARFHINCFAHVWGWEGRKGKKPSATNNRVKDIPCSPRQKGEREIAF